MGSLDGPSGTRLGIQVFTAEKGDYYQLDPGVPIR
jgi:hypothetical protein